ncbi:MAG: hypothetical protein RLO08_02995, partial [Parvibaculaceae bacterium]
MGRGARSRRSWYGAAFMLAAGLGVMLLPATPARADATVCVDETSGTGNGAVATNPNATACGDSAGATGLGGSAFGAGAESSGEGSAAFGNSSVSDGDFSAAYGAAAT